VWGRNGDEKDIYISSWIRDAVAGSEQKGDADHRLEFLGVMWWFLGTMFGFIRTRFCFLASSVRAYTVLQI
jgi:hypothetical protein